MFSGERGYKVLGEKAIIVEINNVRVNNNQEKLEFMKVNVCHILCKRDEFKFHKWIVSYVTFSYSLASMMPFGATRWKCFILESEHSRIIAIVRLAMIADVTGA